jgi:hypothetical protein
MLLVRTELTVFQIRVSTEETQPTFQEEPETCNPTHSAPNLSWFRRGKSAYYGRSGRHSTVLWMTYSLADLWNKMKEDKNEEQTQQEDWFSNRCWITTRYLHNCSINRPKVCQDWNGNTIFGILAVCHNQVPIKRLPYNVVKQAHEFYTLRAFSIFIYPWGRVRLYLSKLRSLMGLLPILRMIGE